MQFSKYIIIWASNVVTSDCDWMKNGPSSKLIKSTSIAQNMRENCHPLDISFREEPWMRVRLGVWRWRWYLKCKEMHFVNKLILWPNIRYMLKGITFIIQHSIQFFIFFELSQNHLKRRWLHMTLCLSFGCLGSSCQVWCLFF